nr:hypothetical protein BaRGS_014313 [Batillaria attramentaria]
MELPSQKTRKGRNHQNPRGQQHPKKKEQEGDTVVLLKRIDDRWLKGKVGDKEGIFPENFINVIHPLFDEGELNGKVGIFPASFVEIIEDLPAEKSRSAGSGSRSNETVALFDFEGEAGELSFQPKSYCTALYDFEGEHEGDLNFREGDHIEILEHIGEDWLKGRLHSKEGTFPTAFVQLDSGEKATVISEGSKWQWGKANGKTGIFPTAFVEIL